MYIFYKNECELSLMDSSLGSSLVRLKFVTGSRFFGKAFLEVLKILQLFAGTFSAYNVLLSLT